MDRWRCGSAATGAVAGLEGSHLGAGEPCHVARADLAAVDACDLISHGVDLVRTPAALGVISVFPFFSPSLAPGFPPLWRALFLTVDSSSLLATWPGGHRTRWGGHATPLFLTS